MFANAIDSIKNVLKKGKKTEINETKFRVLDMKKLQGGASETTIEVTEEESRGNAVVNFWGPNKKKECTTMIKKSKEHEAKFVSFVAKRVVQPLLDAFL